MAQWNKYEVSKTRKWGPGRELRPKSLTIDSHSHVGVPGSAAELAKPHGDPQANPLLRFANARGGLDKRLADLLAHVES